MFSVLDFFKSAKWFEREMFDMFGIVFIGHNDLRRILTDYSFKGFPLLKNFPLVGFVEIVYSDVFKYIVFHLVGLSQTFRFYNFKSI